MDIEDLLKSNILCVASLLIASTPAIILLLTGCVKKKKAPAAVESECEQPDKPSISITPSKQSQSIKNSSFSNKPATATATSDLRLPNIPDTEPTKEDKQSEKKLIEETPKVNAAATAGTTEEQPPKQEQPKIDEKNKENEKKFESKKSQKNEEDHESKKSVKSDEKSKSIKSRSKISEKKNEESDDAYQQVQFGPLETPPK